MEMTIRIDGNKDYEYAKTTLTIKDSVLYVVEEGLYGRLSLHLLNDGYIAYTEAKYSENLSALLKLIVANYYDIILAMKIVEKTGKTIENVGYIQGLSVSDY